MVYDYENYNSIFCVDTEIQNFHLPFYFTTFPHSDRERGFHCLSASEISVDEATLTNIGKRVTSVNWMLSADLTTNIAQQIQCVYFMEQLVYIQVTFFTNMS